MRRGDYNRLARHAVIVAMLTASATGAPAMAADELAAQAAAQGRAIAQSLCISCHLLPDSGPVTVPAGVPTFHAIANRPGQTGERIMHVLISPHAPMPDIQLSRQEIQNITAYLETLRTDPKIPPLIAPSEGTPLPKLPSKS